MKRFGTRLNLQSLERRDCPAQFGVPWTDHLVTISFAPDGTSVDGVASNLFQSLSTIGTNWESEIVRAAQGWASHANLTIGIVNDGGQVAGVGGLQQHDARFGDIRVFGRPLASDVVAITVPPGPATGTRGGDIIINTSQPIVIGSSPNTFDLYSCMLQEVGHALGIDNSTDISSPMYEWYEGIRTGIVDTDVDHITALYGPRTLDQFDLKGSNDNIAVAASLRTMPYLLNGEGDNIDVDADISTPTDADFYSFLVPQNANGTIGVQIHTNGESLLQGRLTIFDDQQQVIWQGAANSPLSGDLFAAISNVDLGHVYTIRVDSLASAGDFTVGRYHVTVAFNPTSPITPPMGLNTGIDDGHTNDTLATATTLTGNAAFPGVYGIAARIGDTTDVDVYKISIPANAGAAPLLTVTMQCDTPNMSPLLSVVLSASSDLPIQVVRNADGLICLQVRPAAGSDVFLIAKADPNRPVVVGDYHLDANLNIGATPLVGITAGVLNADHPVIANTLTVNRASVMHFVLTEDAADASNSFGTQVEITDANGNMVLKFGAAAYSSASADKFLAPGVYKIRVGAKVRTAGAFLPSLAFTLQGFNLSDPIGPRPQNPDSIDPFDVSDTYPDYDPWSYDGDVIF